MKDEITGTGVSGYGFSEFKPGWDQAAIDKALTTYRTSVGEKDVLGEKLWVLIRSEVMIKLRMKLKGDIAKEEGELAALKEFKRRLEKGTIEYISKKYIGFICQTAVRFVISRQIKIISLDSEDQLVKTTPNDICNLLVGRNVRYADLYFCLDKLSTDDRRLLDFHHFDGFQLEETAQKLGIEHDTARKRHSRAIIKLRKCLENQASGGWS